MTVIVSAAAAVMAAVAVSVLFQVAEPAEEELLVAAAAVRMLPMLKQWDLDSSKLKLRGCVSSAPWNSVSAEADKQEFRSTRWALGCVNFSSGHGTGVNAT